MDHMGVPSNPFTIHLILQIVFNYLKVEELKECRRVCKLWDDISTPVLLVKGVISFDPEQEDDKVDLLEWMNSKMWCEESNLNVPSNKIRYFKNFKFESISHSAYSALSPTPVFGQFVKSITITKPYGDGRDLTLEDYEDLLLNKCPILEELVIPASDKFCVPYGKPFLTCATVEGNKTYLRLKKLCVTGEEDVPDARFWRILVISPELKYLTVSCQVSENFWNTDRVHYSVVRNVEYLEVRAYGNESIKQDSSEYFRKAKWPNLKSLIYECYDLTYEVMNKCSHHVGSTLTFFNLVLFNKLYSGEKDWLTPSSMTKLENFVLEIDCHCRGPIFCRALVESIFLSNLKTLRLKMYDDEESEESDWPDGLFEDMVKNTPGLIKNTNTSKDDSVPDAMLDFEFDSDTVSEIDSELKSESADLSTILDATSSSRYVKRNQLTVLQLPPKFQDMSCIYGIRHFFPNITELHVSYPPAKVVIKILERWTKLKRLTLYLRDNEAINWTSILTERNFDMDANSNHADRDFSKNTLANLQNLQSVDIKLIGEGKKVDDYIQDIKCPLTDDLIYHGLIKLPLLQHIVVEGHKFTAKAVEELRQQVYYFCYIEL